ncbi:unnamed protein product [Sphacelaria rigidula]
MSIGILGKGQIGSSLHRMYKLAEFTDVVVRDPFQGLDSSLSECEIVNVCTPYFNYNSFAKVLRDLELRDDSVVIIQSTVGMGCTDRLQATADLPSLVCVQSPVRGVHPNLTEGLLTFEKYAGLSDRFFQDESVKSLLIQHVKSLRMKPAVCRAKESELAEVVSTTLYGENIAAIADVSNLCEDNGVDFAKVFTRWLTRYNVGYRDLGKPNVCRPVLTPIPENEDGQKLVGGHCVVPNCMILKEHMGETNLSEFVLRYLDTNSPTHKTKAADT